MRNLLLGCAAILGTAGAPWAQPITDAPEPPRPPAAHVVLEHVEAPLEIALGTMAINVWASLRLPEGSGPLGIASLVLGEGSEARAIQMRPVDGALDSEREEVVATVDTYAWVDARAHEWRLVAGGREGRPEVVGRGAIRVKRRVSTPDLVLFDARGSAQTWIGTGAGGFTPASSFESGVPGFPPSLGDVTGDGLPDVVWPTGPGRVVVWKNRGAGRFEALHTLDLGPDTAGGDVGDLDGDGKVDLVVASADRTLRIWSGLEEPAEIVAQLTLVPEILTIADVGQGKGRQICVALLGLQQGEVQVWSGAGSAWSPVARLEPPAGGRGRVRALVAHGAAGAGLLVVSELAGEAVLESWGPPADTESVSTPVCRAHSRVPGQPVGAVAGRFAADVPWVALVREGSGAALYGVRLEEGCRRLGSLKSVPGTVVALDLDGDGDDDLVTGGDELRLWINVRGEAFREAGESPYLLDAPVAWLVAGNLDERGS